jgi:hypothetical protein
VTHPIEKSKNQKAKGRLSWAEYLIKVSATTAKGNTNLPKQSRELAGDNPRSKDFVLLK